MGLDKKALGRQIQKARKAKGFTAERLADLCDLSTTHMRQVESGTKGISTEKLVTLCNILEVSSQTLLQDSVVKVEQDDLSSIVAEVQGISTKLNAIVSDIQGRYQKP